MPNRGNQECPGAVATNWFRNEIGRKGSNFEPPNTTTDLSSTPSTFLDPRISAVVAPQDNRVIPASRTRHCCIDTKTHPLRFLIKHLARLFSGADLRNRLRFCVGICLLGCPVRGPDTVVMTLGANGPPRIGEDWCCWCTGVAASAVLSASSMFCVASFGEFAQPLSTQRSASTRNLSPFDRASLTPRRETPSSPSLWHAQPTSASAHRLVAVANLRRVWAARAPFYLSVVRPEHRHIEVAGSHTPPGSSMGTLLAAAVVSAGDSGVGHRCRRLRRWWRLRGLCCGGAASVRTCRGRRSRRPACRLPRAAGRGHRRRRHWGRPQLRACCQE